MVKHWERTGQAKIAVQCKSEEELLLLQATAQSLNLVTRSIQDAFVLLSLDPPVISINDPSSSGRTQIAAGSTTVLGIGPGWFPSLFCPYSQHTDSSPRSGEARRPSDKTLEASVVHSSIHNENVGSRTLTNSYNAIMRAQGRVPGSSTKPRHADTKNEAARAAEVLHLRGFGPKK